MCIRDRLNGSADADAVEAALAGQLFWRYRGGVAAGMLLFFPMLWGLLVLVARRLKAAVPCVRCGLPASGRIDGKEVPHSTCAACFHVFVSSASRVDAGVKLRREHLVVGRNKRRARLTWLLAIPCPGAGHLFAGVAGRGALYAFVFGALLAAIAIVLDFPPGPRLAGPWGCLLYTSRCV